MIKTHKNMKTVQFQDIVKQNVSKQNTFCFVKCLTKIAEKRNVFV